MKLITAVVKPEVADDLVSGVTAVGARGLTAVGNALREARRSRSGAGRMSHPQESAAGTGPCQAVSPKW
jgi:nitrogen regulatory protein PII